MERQRHSGEGERSSRLPLLAIVSLVVATAAYALELWLFVLGIVGGWLRVLLGTADVRLRLLPDRVAATALDPGWRSAGWHDEDQIHAELQVLTAGRRGVVRRARRRVAQRTDDPGRRAVGLERLALVEAELLAVREVTRARRRDQLVLPAMVATAAGVAALLALSERTPGPILDHPWRSAVGIVIAATTGVLSAGAARRDASSL